MHCLIDVCINTFVCANKSERPRRTEERERERDKSATVLRFIYLTQS